MSDQIEVGWILDGNPAKVKVISYSIHQFINGRQLILIETTAGHVSQWRHAALDMYPIKAQEMIDEGSKFLFPDRRAAIMYSMELEIRVIDGVMKVIDLSDAPF